MIGLGFYNVTQTTTDLNGPFLRFTTEPSSTTVNDNGEITLTGIATAEFKHNPTIPGERVTNTGSIGFQWYIDGVAAVDGVVGSGSSIYRTIGLESYINTHNAPISFTQALDDTTGGGNQPTWLQDYIDDIEAISGNAAVTLTTVAEGGHNAFASDATLQAAIRTAVSSSNPSGTIDNSQFTIVPTDGETHTVEGTSYPVMGKLYVPTGLSDSSIDVVVVFHGTLTEGGNSTIAEAASDMLERFVDTSVTDLNVRDKIVFSAAYPQDHISNTRQYDIDGVGTETSTFLLGDNIVYTRAAVGWVKNSLNDYISAQGGSKTIGDVYLFGHSQGGALVSKMNTLETGITGVVADSPGPIQFDQTCSIPANAEGTSCSKVSAIYGAVPQEIFGSQTSTLKVTNLSSPTDNGRSVFLRAVYNGSAYQSVGGDVTAGIAASTGNGVNQPLDTSTITVTVNPSITIDTQPENATAGQGIDATFTVSASTSDSTDVTYQWNQNGNPLSNSDTVSGVNTPTLTISSETIGTSSITVTVSHPTAGNSPVTSDTAIFRVVALRALVAVETVNGSGAFFGRSVQNLEDGNILLQGNYQDSVGNKFFSFYAPEKDTKIKMTLAGASGVDRGSFLGGDGGLTVFNITLEKNTEYLLKLGSQSGPSGGLNGGGGGAFLYKKGRLIVCSGGGGGAGTNGDGGTGGGAGVRGTDGSGRSAGSGGQAVADGTLPTYGISPGGVEFENNFSAPDGGRVAACPPGGPYFRDRYSPCEDIGLSKLLRFDGVVNSGTAEIDRGWKAGIGNRNNGGNGSGNEGGGGAGAYGGDAATSDGSGGGGASGYSSGDVEIVSSINGGNTDTNAYALLELFTG